ncbi:hypothetical protein SESBI_48867 [Sesbania bispinosa]|nr:hypothetical protein SESBI_48867 [Sesbania bispinosa]
MEGGSSSSSNSGVQRLSNPLVDKDPHMGDVPNQDVDEQRWVRRAANREYSNRYRHKQQVRVENLENQEKTIEEEISVNYSPKIKYYQNMTSNLVDEHGSLQDIFTDATSELQADNVEEDNIKDELEQLKSIKKEQLVQISEIIMSKKNNQPPRGPN